MENVNALLDSLGARPRWRLPPQNETWTSNPPPKPATTLPHRAKIPTLEALYKGKVLKQTFTEESSLLLSIHKEATSASLSRKIRFSASPNKPGELEGVRNRLRHRLQGKRPLRAPVSCPPTSATKREAGGRHRAHLLCRVGQTFDRASTAVQSSPVVSSHDFKLALTAKGPP